MICTDWNKMRSESFSYRRHFGGVWTHADSLDALSLLVVLGSSLDSGSFCRSFTGSHSLGSSGFAGGSGQNLVLADVQMWTLSSAGGLLLLLLRWCSAGRWAELWLLSWSQSQRCCRTFADDVTFSISVSLILLPQPQRPDLHDTAWWSTHFRSRCRGLMILHTKVAKGFLGHLILRSIESAP